jgi:photosystem II stability/assembly factor-like uncharacterized protein
VAYWIGLPKALARPIFGIEQAIFRIIRTTDEPRLFLYLGFIALAALILTASGFAMWSSHSGQVRTFGRMLARGALWSQPALVVLIIESALAVNWGSRLGRSSFIPPPPSISQAILIPAGFLVGVFAFFLSGGLPRSGRLGSLGVTALVTAAALLPLLLGDGYVGSERVFSTFTVLPTGRSLVVAAIDCPSVDQCVAQGSNIVSGQLPLRYVTVAAFTSPSSAWKTASLPLARLAELHQGSTLYGSAGESSIACPTSGRCLAIGFVTSVPVSSLSLPVLSTVDGGSHWAVLPVPEPAHKPGANTMTSIGCLNVRDCVASDGQVVVATRDGGIHWQVVARLTGEHIQNSAATVECPTESECIVVSGLASEVSVNPLTGGPQNIRLLTAVTWTTDGGRTWTSRRLGNPLDTPQALACWDSTDCVLSGNPPLHVSSPSLYITTDRGIRWKRLPAPGLPGGLSHIRCVAPQECFGTTGYSVIKTTNGGTSWTTVLRAGPDSSLEVLSCPDAQNCVVGGTAGWLSGGSAALWTTEDGGRTWTRQPFPLIPVPLGMHPCAVSAKACDGAA